MIFISRKTGMLVQLSLRINFTKIQTMRNLTLCLSVALIFLCSYSFGQHNDTKTLKRKLEKIIKPYNATVGVSILSIEDGDTLTINNGHHFPMQSVYKFPLAIAILHDVDKGKLVLSQKIHISKEDLHPQTWSPLREKYPNGNIDLTLGELLGYAVSNSDNNVCDILFGLAGGTRPVNHYIHGIGIREIAIVATEAEMARAWEVQYTNWAQPSALTNLLDGVYHGKYLSDQCSNFLIKIMTETVTGPKRIKRLLPEGTEVAHKTGTSNTNGKGMMAATNDVGIVTLPNGKHFAIAVFVSNTMESGDTNERIIAEIAKATFDYFNGKK